MGGLQRGMEKAAQATSKMQVAMQAAGAAVKAAGSALAEGVHLMHDAGEIIGSLVSNIERFAVASYDKVRDFMGLALEVAEEREHSINTLRAILDDGSHADAVYNEAIAAAQHTPFETAQVVGARVQLALGDFNEAESRTLYAAAADIGAAIGPERQQTLITAFNRIRSSNGINPGMFRQLRQVGLGEAVIFRELATQAHHEELLVPGRERALQAFGRAQIAHMNGNRSLQLLISTIRSRFDHGGEIGQFAVDQSHGLTGMLTRLRQLPQDVFRGFSEGVENLPGIQKFKGFLESLLHLFDTATARGQAFQAAVIHLADALFGGLFGGDAASNGHQMEEIFDGITSAIQDAAGLVERIAPAIRGFISGFSTGFLDSLSGVIGRLGSASAFNPASWEQIGTSIGHMIGVIDNAVRSLTESLGNLAHPLDTIWSLVSGGDVVGSGITSDANARGVHIGRELEGGLRDATQTRSPSRVFAGIGGDLMDGLSMGMEGRAGQVEAALRRSLPVNAAASFAAGIQHRISVDPISVHATGDSGANQSAAGQIGQHIQSGIRDDLRRVDLGGVND